MTLLGGMYGISNISLDCNLFIVLFLGLDLEDPTKG